MRKKLLAMVVSVGMVMAVSACGQKSEKSGSASPNPKSTAQEQKSEASSPKESVNLSEENFNKLNSYKMKTKLRWESDAGATKSESLIEIAYTKENDAKHIKISGSGSGSMDIPATEMLTIGKDSYMLLQGNWIKIPEATAQSQNSTNDYKDFVNSITDRSADYVFKGIETINGMECKKFLIDGTYDTSLPTAKSDGTVEMILQKVKIKGDIWVANEGEQKGILVKEISRVEGKMTNPADTMKSQAAPQSKDTILTTERELLDINKLSKIEPPKATTSMEDMIKNNM